MPDSNTQFLMNLAIASAGLLSAVATLFIALIGWERKTITYEIVSEVKLVSRAAKGARKLQVLFEGRDEPDARLLRVEIKNSGNRPLRLIDYDQDILPGVRGIRLQPRNSASRILQMDVVDCKPNKEHLNRYEVARGKFVCDCQFAYIPQIALNQNESFVIELLLSDASGGLYVDGHLSGFKVSPVKPLRSVVASTLFVLATVAVSLWFNYQHSNRVVFWTERWASAFMAVAVIVNMYVWERVSKASLRQQIRGLLVGNAETNQTIAKHACIADTAQANEKSV